MKNKFTFIFLGALVIAGMWTGLRFYPVWVGAYCDQKGMDDLQKVQNLMKKYKNTLLVSEADESEAIKWVNEANKWFQKAADKGNADGEYRAGDQCLNATPHKYKEAIKWFQKAADDKNKFSEGLRSMMRLTVKRWLDLVSVMKTVMELRKIPERQSICLI